MAFKNKIATRCKVCSAEVPVGAGWTEGPPWVTKCSACSGIVEGKVKIVLRLEDAPQGTPHARAATINPSGFLGGDLFTTFRSCIEGALYKADRRLNVAALDKVTKIIENLTKAGFTLDLDPALTATLQALNAQTKLAIEAASVRTVEVDSRLRERGLALFPFQRTGVEWLVSRFGALLNDEMGLGKTIQALTSIPENVPVLIVAPKVAKGVWLREAKKWRPDLTLKVLEGKHSFEWPSRRGEVVVTNYEILPQGEAGGPFMARLLAETPAETVLIADEAHALKGSRTQRTTSFRALSEAVRKRMGRVWLLTATPLLNRPQELWNIFQAAGIAQEAFGSWKKFVELFNGTEGEWGGYQWGIPTNEVADRLRRVSLCRKRLEVLPELPAKTYDDISVDIDPKTSRYLDRILATMEESGAGEAEEWLKQFVNKDVISGVPGFEEISAGRAALAKAKIPALLEFAEEYEEQEEPLVIFSAHRAPIDIFANREGWAVITGDTPAKARTDIEDAFQAGKLKGVACTIKAGGVAITLTRACHAVFVDREWSPKINEQAEDRLARIGQARGVVIHRLIAKHGLDERIAELLEAKLAIINASVDAASVTDKEVSVPDVDFDKLAAEARAEAEQANKEREEAKKRAAERVAKFNADKEERERKDREERKEREEKAKKEKKDRKARERAKARGWIEDAEHPERRPSESARERWAAKAVIKLTKDDPDWAQEENGIGFNKSDGVVGHWLAGELPKGLTPKQWALVIYLCKKYHVQVGRCPPEEKK